MLVRALTITVCASLQAAACASLSLAIALPIAFLLIFWPVRGQPLILPLFYVWSVMPSKLVALMVELCYRLNGFLGIGCGMVLINLPFAILMLMQAYRSIDRMTILVAASLGARPWRWYWDAVWPQVRSATFGTMGLIFTPCFSSVSLYGVLGTAWYQATPDCMLHATIGSSGSLLVLYGLLRVGVVIAVYAVLGRWHSVAPLDASSLSCVTLPPCRKERLRIRLLLIVVLLFLGVPLLLCAVRGLQSGMVGYLMALADQKIDPCLQVSVIEVIWMTVLIAFWSCLGAALLGSALAALQLYNGHSRWVSTLGRLPLFLGPSGCSLLFAQMLHGIKIPSLIAVIASHVLLNYPLMYSITLHRWQRYSPQWIYGACTFGARSWQLAITLFIPCVAGPLLYGAALIFSLSMTQIGALDGSAADTFMTLPLAMRLYRAAGCHAGVFGLMAVLIGFVLLSALCMRLIDRSVE